MRQHIVSDSSQAKPLMHYPTLYIKGKRDFARLLVSTGLQHQSQGTPMQQILIRKYNILNKQKSVKQKRNST
jgi:hypothetical protein